MPYRKKLNDKVKLLGATLDEDNEGVITFVKDGTEISLKTSEIFYAWQFGKSVSFRNSEERRKRKVKRLERNIDNHKKTLRRKLLKNRKPDKKGIWEIYSPSANIRGHFSKEIEVQGTYEQAVDYALKRKYFVKVDRWYAKYKDGRILLKQVQIDKPKLVMLP